LETKTIVERWIKYYYVINTLQKSERLFGSAEIAAKAGIEKPPYRFIRDFLLLFNYRVIFANIKHSDNFILLPEFLKSFLLKKS
jgi:hypothetical protein